MSYLPLLITFAIIVVGLLLVFWMLRQESEQVRALHHYAVQHGWSVEEHPTTQRAYLIKPAAGAPDSSNAS